MPYQESYVRIHRSKTRLLCAFEQGLGKTISSLERAKVLGTSRLIVVCPKAVRNGWRTNIRRVFKQEALIYQGTAKQLEKLDKQLPRDFIVCTYEGLMKLLHHIEPDYYDQIIVDEVHLASHEDNKRFEAVKELVSKHKNAGLQVLSGTPIQHKPKDLWGIFYLINPKLAGSYEAWVERYEKVVKTMKKSYHAKDRKGNKLYDFNGNPVIRETEIPILVKTQNLDELTEKLKSFMVREKRSDHIKFKDNVKIVGIDLTSRQRQLYNQIKEEILIEISNRVLSLKNAPVRMLRLLQASEGLFNFDRANLESAKLDYIRNILKNTDKKVIVWSRFQEITNILGEEFKDKGVIYNGDMSDNYKDLAKWAFNGLDSEDDRKYYDDLKKKVKGFNFEPGEAQFFFGVIDLRSSLGMDLHRHCDLQIFSSFSWMNTANMQAADRLRRLGQQSDEVTTLFLVANNTFESKALNTIFVNYNHTLQILDGKETVDISQIRQLLNILRLTRD